MDWTKTYFDEDYFLLYEKQLTPARTQAEVAFLANLAFDASIKRILDMPCGYGRHAQELAKLGYIVHGVDASNTMLAQAEVNRRRLSLDVQDRLTFEQSDMRRYATATKFDAALCLFQSFGYFESPEENTAVLSNLCESIRMDGMVILDMRNPIYDLVEFSKCGWQMVFERDGIDIVESLDPVTLRHKLTYAYMVKGVKKERTAIFRQYLLPELTDLFARAGCKIEKAFGSFSGDVYGPYTRRMVIVARRR